MLSSPSLLIGALLAGCSHGQPLEVVTEAQSGEPLGPGHISRWGRAGIGTRAHTLAQEGRQRPAGCGWRLAAPPRAREPGSGNESCRRGCLLSHCLPSTLGALSLSSGLEQPLPGRGFIIHCQAPGSLWEPSRAVQPAESRPEHGVRNTLLGPPDPGPNPASATPARQGRLHL